MPHVVNGIGTWYWGKSNLFARQGSCEFCGKNAELRSYDTTLFFVVVFIPVIPLGRKRIVDACSRCKKHRVAPLAKWLEAQAADFKKAGDDMRANPRDDQKAAAVLMVAQQYRAEQEFNLLAQDIAPRFEQSSLVHAAMGFGYRTFAHHESAVLSFAKSLALEENREIRHALFVEQLRDNRPEDAERTLRPLLAPPTSDGLQQGCLYLLVEGYQSAGDHENALRVLDEIEQRWPGALDKSHKKTRRQSEKYRGTQKTVRSNALASTGARGMQISPGTQRGKIPALILPGALAIFCIGWLIACVYLGQSRAVHLVNGLDRSINFKLAGSTIALAPHEHREARVAEGDLSLQMIDPPGDAGTISIHTSFLSRPSSKTVHVINPDATALLEWHELTYSATPNPNAVNPGKALIGQTEYEFDAIDYPFIPEPHSVPLDNGHDAVKHSLQLATGNSPVQIISYLAREKRTDAMEKYLRALIAVNPRDSIALNMAQAVLKPAEFAALLRSKLAARPVIVPVHRTYQEVMMRDEPAHDLRAEYADFLKRDPDNAQLAYLLGRILDDDRPEATRLFKLAVANPKTAEPFAFHALAYDCAIDGNFDEAIANERKAMQALSDGELASTMMDYLAAAGKYPELLEWVHRDPLGQGKAWQINQELYLLWRMNQANKIEGRETEFLNSIQNDAVAKTQNKQYLDAMLAYLRGDVAQFAQILKQADAENNELIVAICENRTADARKLLDRDADKLDIANGQHPALQLYLAAKLAHDEQSAQSTLNHAIKALRAGGQRNIKVADLLASDSAPAWDVVRHSLTLVEDRALIFTAIGLKFPALRAQCFAEAEHFDYDTRYPHHLLAAARAMKD